MNTNSKEYYAESDNYEDALEANNDENLQAFYDMAYNIIDKVQHVIDDDEETVHISNVVIVASAINEILSLSQWDSTIEVEGKYQAYEMTLEYDFIEQAKEVLLEGFGLKI